MSLEAKGLIGRIPIGLPVKGHVVSVEVPRIGYRWRGSLDIEIESGITVTLLMSGAVAQ